MRGNKSGATTECDDGREVVRMEREFISPLIFHSIIFSPLFLRRPPR